MENKNKEIKKEQLLSIRQFLWYCNHSNQSRVTTLGKLHAQVNETHLQAMERDGFLEPLLSIEESVRQADGSSKLEMVPYYSAFQTYIVSQLIKNDLDSEGRLQSPDMSKEWQETQKVRYVCWGWGGGNSFAVRDGEPPPEDNPLGGAGAMKVSRYLDAFLRMLHSIDLPARYSEDWDWEKTRSNPESPQLQIDLKPFKEKKEDLLKQYDLDLEKLGVLRANVGDTALVMDPLEKWFPFVQRLSQKRKDELKSEALLAQDLYGLCDLIADVVEAVSGTRPKSLPEELRANSFAPDRKRKEYVGGADAEAIKLAASQLKEWLDNESNSALVNEVHGDKVGEYKMHLGKVSVILREFKKKYEKYGLTRYVVRFSRLYMDSSNADPISLDELDERTKRIAQQMIHEEDKDDEVRKQWEIRNAVRWRLDDIERSFRNLIGEIERPLQQRVWQLDAEKRGGQHNGMWWTEFAKSGTAPEDRGAFMNAFWREFVPKKQAEFDEKTKPLEEASRQLNRIGSLSSHVLCANCRKNEVVLHQEHDDGHVSTEAICDECIENGDYQQIKGGEWNCDQCGSTIYRFAHSNVLSDALLNHSQATIQLDYGRMHIRARCPNKECAEWNEANIDWGWLS